MKKRKKKEVMEERDVRFWRRNEGKERKERKGLRDIPKTEKR